MSAPMPIAPRSPDSSVATETGREIVHLRREDLAAVGMLYRQGMYNFPKKAFGIAVFISTMSSLATVNGLKAAGLQFAQADAFRWGTMLVYQLAAQQFVMRRHKRRLLTNLHATCPRCSAALVGDRTWPPVPITTHERVLATGCCPSCGAEVFAD